MALPRVLLLAAMPAASSAAAECGWQALARSEGEVGDLQECEHGAVRFEALQTASGLAGARPGPQRREEAAVAVPDDAPEREGNLHVPAPNMYLADNLDEPNEWGYCIDIEGSVPFTECSKVQGHSCKAEGADGQFEYDAELKAVRSTNFDGLCQALYSGTGKGVDFTAVTGEKGCLEARDYEIGSPFTVAVCDGSLLQRFTYTADRQLVVGDGSLCMAVGVDVTTVGGGSSYMVKRDLLLQDCVSSNASLSTWEFLEFDHTILDPA